MVDKQRRFFAVLLMCLLLVYGGQTIPRTEAAQPGASTGPATVPFARTRPATKPALATSQAATTRAATAPAGLDGCRALFMKGDYAGAAGGYRRLMSKESLRVSAAVGLAEVLAMTGRYDEATETLELVRQAASDNARWRVAMAESLATVGRYEQALEHAERANQLRPTWAPGILVRGQLLETLGRKKQAVAVYKTMEEVIDLDQYRRDAESLVALGRILDRYAVLTGMKASQQADNIFNNYLRTAYEKVDPNYWPARVTAGMFALSKHRPNTAVGEFKLAAKINKNIPHVHVGFGVVALGGWRFEQCIKHADAALKINPKFADALLVKAICLMQWRKFEQVPPVLHKVLQVNPNHLDGLSLMAAAYIRMRQPEKARPYIRRVEKINPRYAGLPNMIGQWLAAGRQFKEAEKYYRKAVELAPEQAGALTNLGLMYMQTGDEGKARDILQKAHEIDDFRADVVNYLGLLDKLEKFQVRETDNFIIKVHGEYDAVLIEQVAAYAEKVYREICDDFNHRPPAKTMIEFFPTHAQFSVRITGRGWIGTVGACTGRVVAMVAPSPDAARTGFGPYNWATVLRHELTHTVTLSATGNRIPHWFTEACAVWEQPDRRNYEAVGKLVAATRRGKLFPIKELTWGFVRPKRGGDRSLAYAQSEWIMEFIIETKGYATIVKMLEGFRDGLTQQEVFEKIIGMKEEDFDKTFGAWAKKQVAGWGFESDPPPELKEAAKAVKASPEDAAAQTAYAVALYYSRKWDKSQQAARKAIELDPNNVKARAVLATILAAKKKCDEAIEVAGKLEQLDHTTATAPRVLARCHLEKKQWAEAIAALELLKRRQHLDPYAYQQLARIYVLLGRPAKALPNLVELHRRTMKDPRYARQIAEIHRSLNQNDKALAYYNQLVYINPYEVSAYKAMTEIHIGAGEYDKAIKSARQMCLAGGDSAESWTYLAVARYHKGKEANDAEQLRQAKQAAEKAVQIEPGGKCKEVLEMIEAALGD